MRRRHLVVLLALGGCLAAEPTASQPSALGGESPLASLFRDAGERHGVPGEILATLAYTETRLRQVTPEADADHSHSAGTVGMVGLSADEDSPRSAARAGSLIGAGVDALRADLALEIDAAAALLDLMAWELGLQPRALGDWSPVLSAWGGDDLAREVMRHMRLGWRGRDAAGLWLVMSARDADDGEAGIGSVQQAAGYPGAIWNPAYSGNYSAGSRGAAQINYVVIHTTQGSYAGTISWFKNSSSNVSSHYVLRSSDGEVTQMVDDSDVAWHDGCFNSESIGLEHEGFVNDPATWYTEAMYVESAKLTAWLCDTYGIPKDRAHIMGHGETPDCSDHTDPGSGWDWDHYMALVNGGGQPSYGAAYAAQDHPAEMTSGEEGVAWFEFANDSNVTWSINDTRLGTQSPQDRESAFYVDGNWLSPNRATAADHSTYSPGSVGRFTFAIRAPEVSETTTFTESFQLVQEGVTWFGPVVTMQITVHPAAGDPPPDDGGDGDGADNGLDPGGELGDEGDGDMSLVGGCAAGAGASGSGCAILLLGLAIAITTRRRRSRSR